MITTKVVSIKYHENGIICETMVYCDKNKQIALDLFLDRIKDIKFVRAEVLYDNNRIIASATRQEFFRNGKLVKKNIIITRNNSFIYKIK